MKIKQVGFEKRTIAEIVTEDFKTAGVFKKYGIDFCCGGKKNLKDVCEQKKLDSQEIIDALSKVSSNSDETTEQYNKWSLDYLTDHIVNTHHKYVEEQVPILRDFTRKVGKVYGDERPETKIIALLFEQIAQELEHHMHKEEQILFPYIKSLTLGKNIQSMMFESVKSPIAMMEQEHEGAGLLMGKIAELSSQYTPPSYACNTYKAAYHLLSEFEKNLHVHVHLENNILFPKVIQLEHEILG